MDNNEVGKEDISTLKSIHQYLRYIRMSIEASDTNVRNRVNEVLHDFMDEIKKELKTLYKKTKKKALDDGARIHEKRLKRAEKKKLLERHL